MTALNLIYYKQQEFAIITDTIIKTFQVPRFTETNRYSQSDLYNAALTLDFDLIDQIVQDIPADETQDNDMVMSEDETYAMQSQMSYGDLSKKSDTRSQITISSLKNYTDDFCQLWRPWLKDLNAPT